MDETVLQPFAAVYAAAYDAGRNTASTRLSSEDQSLQAQREAQAAVRDFIKLMETLQDEAERHRANFGKPGSGGKG